MERLIWLLHEARAQLVRFGLALGALSVGTILVGVFLPLYERFPPVRARRVYSESPLSIVNSLIGYREGWFLVALVALVLLALLAYRRQRHLRTLVALAVVGLGLVGQAATARFAANNPVDYCTVVSTAGWCSPDYPFPDFHRLPAGPEAYGFTVVGLGFDGVSLAGLLLLVPAPVPRPRRKTFAGREAVVWL